MCVGIPRVPRRAQMLVGAPAAIGKFNGMGLAKIDDACRHKLADQRGSVGRDPVVPRGRPAHSALAFDLYEILDRDGYAMERANAMAGTDGLICCLGS